MKGRHVINIVNFYAACQVRFPPPLTRFMLPRLAKHQVSEEFVARLGGLAWLTARHARVRTGDLRKGMPSIVRRAK